MFCSNYLSFTVLQESKQSDRELRDTLFSGVRISLWLLQVDVWLMPICLAGFCGTRSKVANFVDHLRWQESKKKEKENVKEMDEFTCYCFLKQMFLQEKKQVFFTTTKLKFNITHYCLKSLSSSY